MATEAQIAANRANAALSTRPKTLEGKEISRRNALKHGFEARTVEALNETDEVFDRYLDDLDKALSPQDAYELFLVRRLAHLHWRLDRLSRLEAAMLDGMAARVAAIQARYAALGDDAPTLELNRPADDLWTTDLAMIGRYEAQLDNAVRRNMMLLERYRAARRGGRRPGATPIAMSERDRTWEPPKNPNHEFYFRNEANLPAAASDASG